MYVTEASHKIVKLFLIYNFRWQLLEVCIIDNNFKLNHLPSLFPCVATRNINK